MVLHRRGFLSLLTALLHAADGFSSLFDGHSLTAWNIREGPESAFCVH